MKSGGCGAPERLATSASRRLAVDVDESDLRPLAGKRRDDGRADPRSAAGDEDDAILEARIAREGPGAGLSSGMVMDMRSSPMRLSAGDSGGSPARPVRQMSRSVSASKRQAFAMSMASVTRSPTAGVSSGLEARGHLAVGDPQHHHRLGAGRLDHLDRRFEQSAASRRPPPLRMVARDVFRPDAEDDAPSRRRQARAPFSPQCSAPSACRRCRSAQCRAGRRPRRVSAGRKFIAGEPMKPATKMFAGRS